MSLETTFQYHIG